MSTHALSMHAHACARILHKSEARPHGCTPARVHAAPARVHAAPARVHAQWVCRLTANGPARSRARRAFTSQQQTRRARELASRQSQLAAWEGQLTLLLSAAGEAPPAAWHEAARELAVVMSTARAEHAAALSALDEAHRQQEGLLRSA